MRRSWKRRRSAIAAPPTLLLPLAILLLPSPTFSAPPEPGPSLQRPGTVPSESVSARLSERPASGSRSAEIDSLMRWPKEELASALWLLEARLDVARLDSITAVSSAQATIDTLRNRIWRQDLMLEQAEREREGVFSRILDAMDFTLGVVIGTVVMLLSGRALE